MGSTPTGLGTLKLEGAKAHETIDCLRTEGVLLTPNSPTAANSSTVSIDGDRVVITEQSDKSASLLEAGTVQEDSIFGKVVRAAYGMDPLPPAGTPYALVNETDGSGALRNHMEITGSDADKIKLTATQCAAKVMSKPTGYAP